MHKFYSPCNFFYKIGELNNTVEEITIQIDLMS